MAVVERETDAERRMRFERTWQQCRPRLWRLVARLAGSIDLAEDLTQEVCLRAFAAYPDFRHECSDFTWLTRIAINVVNRHRERWRDTLPLDTPGLEHLPTNESHSPEAAALRADLRPVVWNALNRLPDDLRATLILQIYEGLKYREIAAVLDIPLGTVKSRLNNALRRLREELQDYAL